MISIQTNLHICKSELLEAVVPLWLDLGIDSNYGGYFNVMTKDNEVIATDKWLRWQAQQAWAFIDLYKKIENRNEWLQYAQHGIEFVANYGIDSQEIVDCTGRLIKKTTDLQTEAWVIAVLAKAAPYFSEQRYGQLAAKLFQKTLIKREKHLKKLSENILGEQHYKSLSELSALTRALIDCKPFLNEKYFVEKANAFIHELTVHFWEPRANVLLQNVSVWGDYCESIEGRKINAGQIFEAIDVFWELAELIPKRKLIQQLSQQVIYITENTWDDYYGGHYQWLDLKNQPSITPDSDFKLASCHWLSLALLQKVNQLQPKTETLRLWQRNYDFLWQNFRNKNCNGDWHEVLSRHGEPFVSLKASPTKNAFYAVKNLISLIK